MTPERSHPPSPTGKFTPPDGQTLLIIGQDTASIDAYTADLASLPGGVTNYTSVQQLEGIHKTADYGSGPHNIDYLAETYPDSAISVGLSLVNFLPQIAGGKATGAPPGCTPVPIYSQSLAISDKQPVDAASCRARPTVAGGFVGTYIGMYASSNGQISENHAGFDYFDYDYKE